MQEVIMPKLGLTMEEGTIVRWLKEEGDAVEEGDILFEVQTDKVVMEVEATASGILARILVHEDETVPIARVVAFIAAPGEEVPEPAPEVEAAEEMRAEEVTVAPSVTSAAMAATPAAKRLARDKGIDLTHVTGTGKDGMIVKQDVLTAVERARTEPVAEEAPAGGLKASPAARRVAREHGIPLETVPGSGPGGRILEQDVLDFVAHGREPGVEEPGLLPLHPIHKLMAERMSQSFSAAPHFYLGVEVKAAALVDLRESLLPICEEKAQVRLTFTDLLVKMLAATLRNHPVANATWEEGGIRLLPEINIGLATAVDEGLVVPVIKAADSLSLTDIAAARSDLSQKAKAGRLTLDEVTGGTFTLTNLGMLGVDIFQAIINPPQSAILATGRILERPVVENGEVVARPTMYLTLSVDHRVLDGATGARFLQELQALIQDPYQFFLRDTV